MKLTKFDFWDVRTCDIYIGSGYTIVDRGFRRHMTVDSHFNHFGRDHHIIKEPELKSEFKRTQIWRN